MFLYVLPRRLCGQQCSTNLVLSRYCRYVVRPVYKFRVQTHRQGNCRCPSCLCTCIRPARLQRLMMRHPYNTTKAKSTERINCTCGTQDYVEGRSDNAPGECCVGQAVGKEKRGRIAAESTREERD